MKFIQHLSLALVYGEWGYQWTNLGFKLNLVDCYYDQHFMVFHLYHLKIYVEY